MRNHLYTVTAVVVALVLGGSVLSACASSSDTVPRAVTAAQVIRDIIGRGLPAHLTTVYTAASDPTHLLGRPGEYLSKADFGDPRVATATGPITAGGEVDVFPNAEKAKYRAEFIQSFLQGDPLAGSEYDYLNGPILLRVSGRLRPTQAKGYQRALATLFTQHGAG
ncbi:MAG: hypothetical protein ACYDHU_09495 [Acidimicrobiales bacterium]